MPPTCYATLKHRVLAAVLAFAGFAGFGASAQELGPAWNPRSGDAWVDTWLGDMNRYGARYPEPFIDEMVRYHNAPRELVADLLHARKWAPGDIYYACALASVLGRPCRFVVDLFEADRAQGWGTLAQQLGIKPGSPEFHRLKKGIVPTYDRWARPIELDAELRRDFPNHGKDRQKRGRGAQGKAGGQARTKSNKGNGKR